MFALPALLATMFAPSSAATPGDPRYIALVDQSGRAFRLIDLSGRPTAVTFVAARCTDACPIANALFARASKRLRADHANTRLVTITLDPAHDTPAVMRHLARSFGADRDAWRFASGAPADVYRLMRSFGVVEEIDAHGIPEEHTSFVYLIDRDVRLKRTIPLSTALTHDIESTFPGRRS